MSAASLFPTAHRSGRVLGLAPAEWLLLVGVVVGWAIFVVVRGEDRAWDFRNYHWYIPYAFLNGRFGFDVAVAHQATYYNPFLDIPFYWLATHLHSWMALAALGALQGANVVPLYLIGRSVLHFAHKEIAAAGLALLGMTGSLTIYLAGTTYYDNVMSVFVLSGLALVIVRRQALETGPLLKGAGIAAAGGLLVGSAVGLKLPEAPFALGYAAALAALPGDLRRRSARIAGGALGGMLGVALFAGYWFVKMEHVTGNPLFPYFNQYFHSPLALTASYRDVRFIPRNWKIALLFPLLFSIDWRTADDLPFYDIRVGLAYVLVIVSLPLWYFTWRKRQPIVATDGAAALIAFAVVSYLAWLKIFGIYRYILLLEIAAPLLIAICVAVWPLTPRLRIAAAAGLLLIVLGTTHAVLTDRGPVGDPYVQVTIPPIVHPDKTMILMTGETPMGFLAPSFPPQIPIVRIDGWMIQPKDGSTLTRETRQRVDRFGGDLYVVFNPYEAARNKDALKAYGLALDKGCREIVTNLGGSFQFCPLLHSKDDNS